MAGNTRYKEIKQALFDRIRRGEWRPGDRIPGEEDLAEAFGCARATVHRALRELAEDGVLDRQRKSGTTIAHPNAIRFAIEVPYPETDIRTIGGSYAYGLIDLFVRPLPPQDASALERPTGTEALFVRCLHLADHKPFQLEERWIDLETVPAAREKAFDSAGPGQWLIDTVPWSDAAHTLTADAATPKMAEVLGLSPGDPVLIIERRTWNETGTVTFVRLIHPGRSYRISSLRPPEAA